jgi:hypothetical protein
LARRFDRSRDITDFGARRFPLIAVVARIIDAGDPRVFVLSFSVFIFQ